MHKSQWIDAIIWPVQPGANSQSRPVKLVEALARAGVISDTATIYHHGRTPTSVGSIRLSGVLPAFQDVQGNGSAALLTPAVRVSEPSLCWVDAYDDWSIAPDLRRLTRFRAKLGYRRWREWAEKGRPVITTNSPYMAHKLGLPLSSVVPNGVDLELGYMPRGTNEEFQIVVLGHFFHRRTDFSLLLEAARAPGLARLVVGAPGNDPQMVATLRELSSLLGSRLTIANWLGPNSLANLSGPRAVGLIPHIVSDYTVSQDLMKVYQFHALGFRVACPILLYPAHLSKEHAFLIGPGSDLADLAEWTSQTEPPSDTWRQTFSINNCWARRADRIARLIG